MKKLIIIPAYNEEASIFNTVSEIVEHAPEFDYVVINDCSTDHTKKICEENHFNVINLPMNLGIGGAVQTGYKYAQRYGYDCAVQVDGDGQHRVDFLKKMVQVMEDDKFDMVIGSRFIEKQGFQSTGLRRIGIKYFSLLIKLLSGTYIADPTSGLRLIGKKAIESFANDYPKDYPEPETTMRLLKKGLKVKEIPVIMRERQGGVSSISTIKKSSYYMVKVTIAILLVAMGRKVSE